MENQFNKEPATSQPEKIEGYELYKLPELFGRFLLESRIGSRGPIAKKLGVDKNTLSRWENGKAFPDPEKNKLSDIAEAYGVNLGELERRFKISTDAKKQMKSARRSLGR